MVQYIGGRLHGSLVPILGFPCSQLNIGLGSNGFWGWSYLNSPLYAQLVLCYKIFYWRHAVTCRRSGAITRCHNILRDVAKSIAVSIYGTRRLSPVTIPSDQQIYWSATGRRQATGCGPFERRQWVQDQACQKKFRQYRQAWEGDGWLFCIGSIRSNPPNCS